MLNQSNTKMVLLAAVALLLLMSGCGSLPQSQHDGLAPQAAEDGNSTPTNGGNPNAMPTTNPNAMPSNPNAMPSNPNAMPADPNATKCADTWANYAQNFFKTNCLGCHPTFGDPNVIKMDAMIQTRISSGSMPMGSTLPAADKARILGWIDCKEP